MTKNRSDKLSRREREIMDVVFRLGHATVADVRERMADPPSYSAVRATMGVLEDKGLLRHHKDGRRFVYSPTQSRDKARASALRHLMNTFFDGSAEGVVASLLELSSSKLTPESLERLRQLIEDAEKEGR